MDTKDLYMKYGLMLRKRNTSNQKIRFLSELEAEFQKLNFKTSIRKTKLKGKESYSLYVGDLINAKKIIATTYDTPNQTFIKMPYSPFNDENKKKRTFISLTVPTLFSFAIGISLVIYFASNAWRINPLSLISFIGYILVIACMILFRMISKGIPTMDNYKTNTSSIVEIIKYAKSHKHTGYVFTDYGTQDSFGYLCLRDYLENNRDYKIFFIDSIGNGGSPLIKVASGELKENMLSNLFPNSICVSSGELIQGRIVQNSNDETFDQNESLLEELQI